MKCPFCEAEMQHGEIVSGAKGGVYFHQDGKKPGFFDALAGIGRVEAATGLWTNRIPADYCANCRKMIFDTEIGR